MKLWTVFGFVLIAVAITFSTNATADDAAVAGKWTAEVQGRNGTQTQTFTLKPDGGNLTGSVSGMGGDTAISDGKISGNTVSFSVTREFRGNTVKMNYTGKVAGDEIHFQVKTEGRDQAQEMTAKRAGQ